jgi:Ni2+-binding GTPase involved in maturation of urease and hydrogenase
MDQYIVKGYVQSGKTNFIIQSSLSFLKENFSVIIIVRDRKSDREQLFRRFKNAGIKIGKNIHIVLGNASSISKIDKNAKIGIIFNDFTNPHPYHRYVFDYYKKIYFSVKPL